MEGRGLVTALLDYLASGHNETTGVGYEEEAFSLDAPKPPLDDELSSPPPPCLFSPRESPRMAYVDGDEGERAPTPVFSPSPSPMASPMLTPQMEMGLKVVRGIPCEISCKDCHSTDSRCTTATVLYHLFERPPFLFSTGALDTLLDYLKERGPAEAEIARHCCACLWNCCRARYGTGLLEKGALHAVVACIRAHLSDEMVVWNGMAALFHILNQCVPKGDGKDAPHVLVTPLVGLCVEVLSWYPTQHGIVDVCFYVVGKVIERGRWYGTALETIEGVGPLPTSSDISWVNVLREFIARNIGVTLSGPVHGFSTKKFAHIHSVPRFAVQAPVDAGVDAHKKSLSLMMGLGCVASELREEWLPLVLDSMAAHPDDKVVQRMGCTALVSLSESIEPPLDNVLDVLSRAIIQHHDEPTLVTRAAKALVRLLAKDPSQKALQCLRECHAILKGHVADDLRFAQSLATFLAKDGCTPTPDVLPLLFEAVRSWGGDDVVLRKASRTLAVMQKQVAAHPQRHSYLPLLCDAFEHVFSEVDTENPDGKPARWTFLIAVQMLLSDAVKEGLPGAVLARLVELVGVLTQSTPVTHDWHAVVEKMLDLVAKSFGRADGKQQLTTEQAEVLLRALGVVSNKGAMMVLNIVIQQKTLSIANPSPVVEVVIRRAGCLGVVKRGVFILFRLSSSRPNSEELPRWIDALGTALTTHVDDAGTMGCVMGCLWNLTLQNPPVRGSVMDAYFPAIHRALAKHHREKEIMERGLMVLYHLFSLPANARKGVGIYPLLVGALRRWARHTDIVVQVVYSLLFLLGQPEGRCLSTSLLHDTLPFSDMTAAHKENGKVMYSMAVLFRTIARIVSDSGQAGDAEAFVHLMLGSAEQLVMLDDDHEEASTTATTTPNTLSYVAPESDGGRVSPIDRSMNPSVAEYNSIVSQALSPTLFPSNSPPWVPPRAPGLQLSPCVRPVSPMVAPLIAGSGVLPALTEVMCSTREMNADFRRTMLDVANLLRTIVQQHSPAREGEVQAAFRKVLFEGLLSSDEDYREEVKDELGWAAPDISALFSASPGALKQHLVRALTEQRAVDPLPINQTCSVCLEEQDGSDVVQLDCKHIFHSACLFQWLQKNSTCPMCRHHLAPLFGYPDIAALVLRSCGTPSS